MTSPFTGDYSSQFGLGSDVARREWEEFLERRKQLLQLILGAAQPLPDVGDTRGTTRSWGGPEDQIAQQGAADPRLLLTPRPTSQGRELIAQANVWGIPDPEQMDAEELREMIHRRRAEMPEDEIFSGRDALGAGILDVSAFTAQIFGQTAEVTGNVIGLVEKLPFAGEALSRILGTEKAKQWLYGLNQKVAEYVEIARAAQPGINKTSFEVGIATGKIAGYAIPGALAWNTVGAMSGIVPSAWAAQVPTAFMRAGIQGGLSGALLEGGSDEPVDAKVFNIGLGFALGFGTALPKVGASIGLGAVGIGIGAQVGDTPEQRTRNAILGGVIGATAGAAPLFIAAAQKVRADLPGPFDRMVDEAVAQLPSGAKRGTATIADEAVPPGGPDYTVENAPLQVRSEPPLEARPQIAGYLETPVVPYGEAESLLAAASSDMSSIAVRDPMELHNTLAAARYRDRGLGQQLTAYQGPAYSGPGKLSGTRVVGRDGQPLTVYHGTAWEFENFDLSRADPDALYGPGFYHTESADIASGYTGLMSPLDLPTSTANIRPARLRISNPFDIDKVYTGEEADAIVMRLAQALPDYDIQDPGFRFESRSTVTGDELYHEWQALVTRAPQQGPEAPSNVVENFIGRGLDDPSQAPFLRSSFPLGKIGLNQALQSIGFDGITHIGGRITGSPPHRVWIAFSPEQVYSPWDVEAMSAPQAAASADAMQKQAIILESPLLPDAIGKAKITDVDVVEAAYIMDPAGVSIVRSLSNPLEVMNSVFWADQNKDRITFVRRGDRFDALVGDASSRVADEYRKYGLFTGQKVVTGSGIEGEVSRFTAKGLVVVKRASGPPLTVRPDKLLPGRNGRWAIEVPDLWESFRADTLLYINDQAKQAGMSQVQDMIDSRVAGVLQSRMVDFLDRMGINDPAQRQVIELDFNQRWLEEFKALDPESQALQSELVASAVEAHNVREASDSHHIVVSLEELAEKRGFIFVAAAEGGTLKDAVNPGQMDVELQSDEAVRAFLAGLDRMLPDYTPAAEVPLEVADMLPTNLGRDSRLAAEDHADNLVDAVDGITDEPDRSRIYTGVSGPVRERGERFSQNIIGGGNRLPPPPPPPPPGRLPPGGQPSLIGPGPQETLPMQFDKMRRADPEKVAQLDEDFMRVLTSKLRYTRYGMLNLEEALHNAGVDKGIAWQHYAADDAARAVAFNEGQPWLKEAGSILRMVPRKVIRDGTLERIREIRDPVRRGTAYRSLTATHKLSDDRISKIIKADAMLDDWWSRILTYTAGDPINASTLEQDLKRYITYVRAGQAQNKVDWKPDWLQPGLEFFADFAQKSNLQFRIVDSRQLMGHYIRAIMFERHRRGAWEAMVSEWDDPRVPEGIREYMMDYANLSRYGYNPHGEFMVQGVKGIMNRFFKTPVTTQEAQHMLNMPTGAMYMAMLGGKGAIFFRDALQPLEALAKVEIDFMGGVYRDILVGAGKMLSRSEENRLRSMYERGIRGGWIERENPNFEAAGVFEEAAGLREQTLHLTAEQATRRERAALIGDILYELPAWLARPSQSNINTLKWYGRQGQLHRLIVGEAAYRQSTSWIAKLRQSEVAAVIQRDPTLVMPYEGKGSFEDRSYFGSFEGPIRRRLQGLIEQNTPEADDEAANTFAREVANWSQHKYGRKEMPPILRSNIGRMTSFLGNFTGQFVEGTYSAMAQGKYPRYKARFGMVVGGISALMYSLKNETGWGFDKWAWIPHAFEFAGSPFLQRAARAVIGAGGAVAASQGRELSQVESAVFNEMGRSSFVGEFFPYRGYVRSLEEYANAAQGINPLEQAARYTVTGDRGSRVDIERMLEDYARRNMPGGHIPQGQLSPNGGLMPGQQPVQPQNYGPPRQVPGAGAQQ